MSTAKAMSKGELAVAFLQSEVRRQQERLAAWVNECRHDLAYMLRRRAGEAAQAVGFLKGLDAERGPGLADIDWLAGLKLETAGDLAALNKRLANLNQVVLAYDPLLGSTDPLDKAVEMHEFRGLKAARDALRQALLMAAGQ